MLDIKIWFIPAKNNGRRAQCIASTIQGQECIKSIDHVFNKTIYHDLGILVYNCYCFDCLLLLIELISLNYLAAF